MNYITLQSFSVGPFKMIDWRQRICAAVGDLTANNKHKHKIDWYFKPNLTDFSNYFFVWGYWKFPDLV